MSETRSRNRIVREIRSTAHQIIVLIDQTTEEAENAPILIGPLAEDVTRLSARLEDLAGELSESVLHYR